MLNPYQILNVSPDASIEEIKKAYFRLVRKYPPETEPEKFKTIRQAYEQLKTLSVRVKTDFSIIKEPTGDFIMPPSTQYDDSYLIDISFHDFIVVAEALYSDLTKTDFKKDWIRLVKDE
jgi:curved DNA-binding protein CbpA